MIWVLIMCMNTTISMTCTHEAYDNDFVFTTQAACVSTQRKVDARLRAGKVAAWTERSARKEGE